MIRLMHSCSCSCGGLQLDTCWLLQVYPVELRIKSVYSQFSSSSLSTAAVRA